ncbi:uncharacterized protein LOC132756121 [Ruditapes philippinarum]|uniref:uncharacterized protein LOC132756121 n=1 Tax=Ruditapes philippinarum TaxID=129788 RepID=UPI00295A7307|nr:uncharacterized protein LOC132756121 [Ruditapes philippinarum]
MALLRFLKRRLSFLGLVFIATIFWIFYLILSAPAASDSSYHHGVLPHDQGKVLKKEVVSVTRKVMVEHLQPKNVVNIENKGEKQIQPPKDADISGKVIEVPEKQVIPRPPPEIDGNIAGNVVKPFGDINRVVVNEKSGQKNDSDKVEGSPKAADIDKSVEIVKQFNGTKNVTEKESSKKLNETVNISKNVTHQPVLKQVEKQVIKLGQSFKNKTIGDWETVKNKTLEKLTNLGVIKKTEYIKLIYTPVKWILNISFEDIGNIMKDTQYFQVKQNLTEMEYHPLMSPNSTQKLNVTEVKYGLGYCDCKDLECMCCVRVYNKWMRLNNTACSLITFSSKSQELQFVYSIDKMPIFDRKIAAEFPPKICLESSSKVAGICTLFSNVTAKVKADSDIHKIHLSGCLEYDLTLYNRTVSSFPVGCFEIPGRQSTHKEENRAQNLGNFMP